MEGLVTLAIAAMDLAREEGSKEEKLRNVYNALAGLLRMESSGVEKYWRSAWKTEDEIKENWVENPMKAFILRGPKDVTLAIPVMPIEIDTDLRKYHKGEKAFIRSV